MNLSVVAFEAKAGDTLEGQVSDCLGQMDVFISNASFTLKNIISKCFRRPITPAGRNICGEQKNCPH